ncbi:unnamed protein product [Adineta ricciae]|uniref:histone deacetylase n=1 Tax=Adineta ricciae TaxID=249248 RepID=A0A814J848_ADIRI|nr:unnamed protein product [Adineta ricciae]CAF1424249.1 unnamed protein product [Adineta ricciae]
MTNKNEDADGFGDLFENNECKCDISAPKQRKPSYEPVHVPCTISDILQIWSSQSNDDVSSRLGICPGDVYSLDGMFLHTWGETHVEQPSRLTSIIECLHNHFWINHQYRWKLIEGRMITNEEILLVHSERLLQEFLLLERGEEINDDFVSVRTLSYANAEYNLESVGPITARACRTAAGSTLRVISSVVSGDLDCGFALVRPAGHHSSSDHIGTFCGLNSVAIGAVYAIRILHVDRVLILDWDVHRSGGTEQILGQMSLEDSKKYHLIDIYAAFGKLSHPSVSSENCQLIDMYNRNQIPGDTEYLHIFDMKILPCILEYCPSLIIISAGFDAAIGDSEECAQITANGYFQMTKRLKHLNIPLVFILEGGYNQHSLIQSIEGTFRALLDLS